MPNFQHIFDEATAPYNQSGIFAGAASINVWSNVFAFMRRRLDADGATPDDRERFRQAILNAIDTASDRDLRQEERTALRQVLLTAFDGLSRSHSTTVAPKAQFLSGVTFPA